MKKSLVFASMMLAALAVSAAAVTPGPEPNKQVTFAFAKADNSPAAVLVAVAPNEIAGNMQSSGFMITSSQESVAPKMLGDHHATYSKASG